MIEYIKQLKEDPLVYYIYQVGLSIYNIPEDNYSYIVIIDPKFKNTKTEVENCNFIFYSTDKWFDKVLNNDIDAWICSCLNKKFIIKEHVKILIKPNILKLRQQALYNLEYKHLNLDYKEYKDRLFKNICVIKLINQILENHKIINFSELTKDYKKLSNAEDLEYTYNEILRNAEKITHKLTDDLYNQYIINKFKDTF